METSTPPTPAQTLAPKHKLHWYQFSLRTLLIVVTLFAFACSWFTVTKLRADRQKASVKALESHGYEIVYDYEHYATQRSCDIPTAAPDWIVGLVGKDFLYDVYSIGDLVSLPGFIKCHMPALTDADMVVFGQIPQLRKVRFCNRYGNPAKLTDQGMTHLEKLTYLEFLDLSNTQVTDAGLKYLKGLTRLQSLNLDGTHVTDDGVRDLQNSLPSLVISHKGNADWSVNPYEWPEEECIRITTKIKIP